MAVKTNPAQVQKFLEGLMFPATKGQVINHVKEHGADQDILQVLDRLPEQSYESTTEIHRELNKLD